jgi:hypothetical protein
MRWQVNNSVASKYMVLILFPFGNVEGLNIEECKEKFKKAV